MTNKARSEVSILLVQPRADAPMIEHELTCIARYADLEPPQLRSVTPFKDAIEPQLLADVDGVIIGGSDTSVLDEFPWSNSIIRLIHQIAEVKMPLFGSCWGHQM